MTENITFMIKTGKDTQEDIDKLNNLLNYLGASAKLQLFENNQGALSIRYDESDAKLIRTRRAGKSHVRLSERVYLKDIDKMIKETSAKETAEHFKMSTATMYRKIKKAKEENKSYII